ncbi:MAG: hypothetical protein AAF625_01000 [Pseudomonadota bacterium]
MNRIFFSVTSFWAWMFATVCIAQSDFTNATDQELLSAARQFDASDVPSTPSVAEIARVEALNIALSERKNRSERDARWLENTIVQLNEFSANNRIQEPLTQMCSEGGFNTGASALVLGGFHHWLQAIDNSGGTGPTNADAVTSSIKNIFPEYDLYTGRNMSDIAGAPSDPENCTLAAQLFRNLIPNLTSHVESAKLSAQTELSAALAMVADITTVQENLSQYSINLQQQGEQIQLRERLDDRIFLLVAVFGAFGIISIWIVRFFPENVVTEWVSSGQVIQFVTVTIILSVVMSLGLSGVLNEDTLGTLLGGIGGYVLSQGVGRAAAHRAQQNAQPTLSQPQNMQQSFQTRLDAIGALLTTSAASAELKSSVELLIAQASKANEENLKDKAASLLDSAQFLLERQ